MFKSVETDIIIDISEMEDCDVGVLIDKTGYGSRSGRIVQRYKDNLITLGSNSGHGWSSYFKSLNEFGESKFNVQLLKKGDMIVFEPDRYDSDFDVDVVREITKGKLPDGWDEKCIPFGGDGNTRIGDFLGENDG